VIVHVIKTRLESSEGGLFLCEITEEKWLLFGLIPLWVNRTYRKIK
jgi:hypothetical protein